MKIVKSTDEYEGGKLKIVLKDPKGTKHMKLKLIVDTLWVANWWKYASYNTHDDFRDHKGDMTRLGKGGVLS